MEGKKIFLLDAYALIFRAYYAFIRNPIKNSKGMNTSAVFGFANTLLEILNVENPDYIGVVFDPPTPTFRHEMYPEYKANRDETPEDIRLSVPYIKQLIDALNIPIVQIDGFEADDVIGSLAIKAEEEGVKVYMMTPDKDFAQLVTENIVIYKPRKGGNEAEIMGVEEIKEKYSLKSPGQFIDILALMGDSADNIPGAPGVGEKTAIKLIQEFETLDNIIEKSDTLKGKLKEKIQDNIDLIRLSKDLATIKSDVELEFNIEHFKKSDPDKEALVELFKELEFKTLLNKFTGETIQPTTKKSQAAANQAIQGDLFGGMQIQETVSDFDSIETSHHNYQLVENEEKIRLLISQVLSCDEVCFDTETTSVESMHAELVGIAISFKEKEAYYIPVSADRSKADAILEILKPFFENENILKIGQNLKYDIQVLNNYQISVKGKLFDTMIAHYVLEPEAKHGMDYLAETYLNYSPVSITSLIGEKGKNQRSMRSVEVEKVKEYAGEDADITFRLKKILEKELKEIGLYDLVCNIEFPLVQVLSDIEIAGVMLDVPALNDYAKILTAELQEVEKSIYELSGTDFNIASPKQLGEVLFDRMKIDPNAKRTKTKQYSTGEEVLLKLKDKHEIVDKILTFRSLKKLLSTYVEALPKLINTSTNKIHTSFNQTITATGRLSSNNPNLQNIPIREERGREIRKAFIPSDNEHIMFSADYSQIELRLMAHVSDDKNMIDAFANNEDIHASTAAKIFGIELNEVTKEQRSKAKTANFGIIYGISAFGLSQRLGIPRTEAKELIDGYFSGFPGVHKYMEKCIVDARDKGYVETILGRRRYLKDINSRNQTVRGFAERNAINAPIQGSAADIIKIAMIEIHNEIRNKYKTKMILQVHDELVFDVYQHELEDIKKLVKEKMESAIQLKVPLIVDMDTGNNWLEAH